MKLLQKTICFCFFYLAFVLSIKAQNNLPQIGTAGSLSISLTKEKELGDYYYKNMIKQEPIILDPVLDNYINNLGYKLLRHSDNVDFAYNFFLVKDPNINAFAFFGGNIGVNSGLILKTKTQSELASVIAHEIAHVSQRHLARIISAREKSSSLTIASLVGSLMLAVVSPEAAMAGISATVATGAQTSINYTRNHEQEADRIGIQTLYEAGFDPNGMPDFFQTLANENQLSSNIPEILLTHPMPSSRLSEARVRSYGFKKETKNNNELDYLLAKARIKIRYSKLQNLNGYLKNIAGKKKLTDYEIYEKALVLFALQKYNQADLLITNLLKKNSLNLFYLDLKTDTSLAKKDYSIIKTLEKAKRKLGNNNVILMNLAQSYLEQNNIKDSANILELSLSQKENFLAYKMLTSLHKRGGKKLSYYIAKANELEFLTNYEMAISKLQTAHQLSKSANEKKKIEARIRNLRQKILRIKELI